MLRFQLVGARQVKNRHLKKWKVFVLAALMVPLAASAAG